MKINELIISDLVIKNKQTIDVHPTRINKTKTNDRQQFLTRKCACHYSLNSEKKYTFEYLKQHYLQQIMLL
jgi:hypothetical protein